MRHANRALLVLVPLILGCGEEGPRVIREVSDSSGVAVVSLSGVPPATSPEYQWELELRRSIPTSRGSSGMPLLFDPRSITRLEDGTLVVADAGERPLAVIPADQDTVVRAFSALGQGPGEIYGGYPVLWPGEDGSFWVADRGNSRVSQYDTTGALLRQIPIPPGGVASLALSVQEETGRLYSQQFTFPAGDRAAATHAVAEVDYRGGEQRVVVPLPQENDPPGVMYLWNGRALWTVLDDGHVVTGNEDSREFRVWSGDGELERSIRLDLEARPVTERDRQETLEELGRSPTSVEFAESFPFSDIYYPFSDSVFAMRHTFISHAAGDEVEEGGFVWRLVSSGGHYMGTLNLPFGFEPKWSDGLHMVGVLRDSLGVATLQEYRLKPPPGMG